MAKPEIVKKQSTKDEKALNTEPESPDRKPINDISKKVDLKPQLK